MKNSEETDRPVPAGWETAGRVVGAAIAIAALAFLAVLVVKNVAPFGARVDYHIYLEQESNKSLPKPLTPSTALGVEEDESLYEVPEVRMAADSASFELNVPYGRIDNAEVTMRYRGDPGELLFGMAAGSGGPYVYKPVHNRSLNQLPWDRLEEGGKTLFQRNPDYRTIDQFLAEPPLPAPGDPDYARVAGYYLEVPQPPPDIDPALVESGTKVDASLRGSHSLYLYVGSEPLRLSFNKRELNWEEGPDPLNVSVIGDEGAVRTVNVPDDGIEDDSRQYFQPQPVEFTVEGLAEGTYRVDLACGYDVIIEGLESAQGYLSFFDHVYCADHELYGMGPTRPVTLYTNEQELTVWTWHPEAFQVLTANGDASLELNSTEASFPWGLPPGINEIHAEKGGFALTANKGIFSFSRDRFFDPFPLKTETYGQALMMTNIDYVLADYTVPVQDGEWYTCKLRFGFEGVEITDNKIRCVISAPGLVKSGGDVVLSSIDVRLEK